MSEQEFEVTLEQIEGLEFKVGFDWDTAGELLVDEPEPLGHRRGPNASRLVAAAVGNCLTASLAFCLHRSRVEMSGFRTVVKGELERNERNRLRMAGLEVTIHMPTESNERARVARCLELFEDFCIVTASIRQGIPVDVKVVDSSGRRLDTAGTD